jgi:hypothetical protein
MTWPASSGLSGVPGLPQRQHTCSSASTCRRALACAWPRGLSACSEQQEPCPENGRRQTMHARITNAGEGHLRGRSETRRSPSTRVAGCCFLRTRTSARPFPAPRSTPRPYREARSSFASSAVRLRLCEHRHLPGWDLRGRLDRQVLFPMQTSASPPLRRAAGVCAYRLAGVVGLDLDSTHRVWWRPRAGEARAAGSLTRSRARELPADRGAGARGPR